MGLFFKVVKGVARAAFKGAPQIGASYEDITNSNPFEKWIAVVEEVKEGWVKYDYLWHQEGSLAARWTGIRYSSVAEFNLLFEFYSAPGEEREEDQIPF